MPIKGTPAAVAQPGLWFGGGRGRINNGCMCVEGGGGGGGGGGGCSDAPDVRQGFPWKRNYGRLHTEAHTSS